MVVKQRFPDTFFMSGRAGWFGGPEGSTGSCLPWVWSRKEQYTGSPVMSRMSRKLSGPSRARDRAQPPGPQQRDV